MPLPRLVVWHVFLRSFAIQGSWNYRTLLGSGFAFALMPALRHIHGDEGPALQDAVARHTALFNTHPYLSGVALGAVARMEADGEDPHLIERFKDALRTSLGSLGDRIIWAGWRPACALLGLAVLLVTQSAAAAVISFLLVYNSGHLSLRWWALHIGLRHGKQVGETLRRAPLTRFHGMVVLGAAFLVGLLLPLVAAGAMTGDRLPLSWTVLPTAAAIAGWRMGGGARTPALAFLVIAAITGLLLSLET